MWLVDCEIEFIFPQWRVPASFFPRFGAPASGVWGRNFPDHRRPSCVKFEEEKAGLFHFKFRFWSQWKQSTIDFYKEWKGGSARRLRTCPSFFGPLSRPPTHVQPRESPPGLGPPHAASSLGARVCPEAAGTAVPPAAGLFGGRGGSPFRPFWGFLRPCPGLPPCSPSCPGPGHPGAALDLTQAARSLTSGAPGGPSPGHEAPGASVINYQAPNIAKKAQAFQAGTDFEIYMCIYIYILVWRAGKEEKKKVEWETMIRFLKA